MSPRIDAEKIGLSAATGSDHSGATAGATKLIAWVSTSPDQQWSSPCQVVKLSTGSRGVCSRLRQ